MDSSSKGAPWWLVSALVVGVCSGPVAVHAWIAAPRIDAARSELLAARTHGQKLAGENDALQQELGDLRTRLKRAEADLTELRKDRGGKAEPQRTVRPRVVHKHRKAKPKCDPNDPICEPDTL